MTLPQAERESYEPRGRRDCIDFSLRTFSPSFPFTMGARGFEERYLGAEVLQDAKSHILIPSLAAKLRPHIFGLLMKNTLANLTDKDLRDMREDAEQKKDHVGLEIKAKAEELGLVTLHTAEESEALLDTYSGQDFRNSVEGVLGYGILYSQGWKIYKGENDSFVLITPPEEESGEDRFAVTPLDDLFAQDPDFLTDKIQSYYELHAREYVANHIIYNLALHAVDGNALIPRSINAISNDPQKRDKEIAGLVALLRFFGALGDYPTRLVDEFMRDLRDRNQALPGEGHSATDIVSYLDHIVSCPREPLAVRKQAVLREDAFYAFSTVEFDPLEPDPDTTSQAAKEQHLLMHPLQYTTIEMDKTREEIREQKETGSQRAQFIRETQDITDRTEFMEALEQRFPKTFSILSRLIQHVGVDYRGKGVFDRFLEGAANSVLREGATAEQAVERELHTIRFFVSDFPEIASDWRGTRISSPQLQFLLPLMVLKTAQARSDDNQAVTEKIKTMAKKYEQEVNERDKTLRYLQEKEELMKAIMAHYNIPEEVINQLVLSVQPAEGERDPQYTAFTFAFSALVLSEYLDRSSPAFRAFAKELYPGIRDETLDILQGQ